MQLFSAGEPSLFEQRAQSVDLAFLVNNLLNSLSDCSSDVPKFAENDFKFLFRHPEIPQLPAFFRHGLNSDVPD